MAAAPVRPATAQRSSSAPGDELKRSTLQGVKWNFLATLATLVGRLVFTFALARILGPANFGVVAVATVYIAFVVVVLDQGFGIAIVQKVTLDESDVGSVSWLNLATGGVLALLTFFASPAVADFFHTPQLDAVLKALSVTLILRGLVLVPMAMVRRELRFKEQALAQTVAMLVGGGVGIASGLLGAGYWALVIQTILTDLVTVVWLVAVVGRTSWRASWSSLRSMLGFSTQLMLSSLLVFFGANSDNLLVARFEGATQLAFYALAYRLLRLPIQMSASVVTGVALPVLSRLQDDDERTRTWFLTATQALGLLTFPVFALLAVGAHDGMRAIFGVQWVRAAAPVQAMALAGAPMVVRMLLPPLATARGWTRNVLNWSVITVGLQVMGFVIGIRVEGMVGVAVALLVVQWVTWLPNVARTLTPLLGVRLPEYLSSLRAPALASGGAGAVWWLTEQAQARMIGGPLALHVTLSALVALAAYVAVIRLVWRDVYRSTADILRQMARRGAPAT